MVKNIRIEKIKDESKFLIENNSFGEIIEVAIKEALKKVDYAMQTLGDKFASHCSINNIYEPVENTGGWNQGFWSGILWLSYELTGEEKYKVAALKHIDSYYTRIKEKIGIRGHDVGFLYSLSCVAAYKLTGNEKAKEAAIMAADHLMSRFQEKGQFIQAWGEMDNLNEYRLIVDCLLNIPILYWATEVTGNKEYADIAYKHFRTTIGTAVRDDGSAFHTYYFDPDTGAPLKGVTKQGINDNSSWARGQAWIIYGMMLTRKYINDPDAINICRAAANYYINHLPEDYVPYWDLTFKDEDNEEKDSSAAPIVVCGLLELLKYLPEGDERTVYENAVKFTMTSLYENYSTKDCPESNGLLLHAVYSKPNNVGIDECNIWGCYFYMEALVRLKKDWRLYW